MTTEVLTVGEVARLGGVTTATVRFYEARGLITATRTSGNQRRYEPWVPCAVRAARVAQRVGLSIEEIADVFRLTSPTPTPEAWQAVTNHLIAQAHARIAELEAVLEDLRSSTELCDLPTASR